MCAVYIVLFTVLDKPGEKDGAKHKSPIIKTDKKTKRWSTASNLREAKNSSFTRTYTISTAPRVEDYSNVNVSRKVEEFYFNSNAVLCLSV